MRCFGEGFVFRQVTPEVSDLGNSRLKTTKLPPGLHLDQTFHNPGTQGLTGLSLRLTGEINLQVYTNFTRFKYIQKRNLPNKQES
jgi:hypothetical protein